jgi:alpha-galactosidase
MPTRKRVTIPIVSKGKLPALGYNTYNAYKCVNTEADMISEANSIYHSGLKLSGINMLTVDTA